MVIINIQSLTIFIFVKLTIFINIHSCDKYFVDSKQIDLAIFVDSKQIELTIPDELPEYSQTSFQWIYGTDHLNPLKRDNDLQDQQENLIFFVI